MVRVGDIVHATGGVVNRKTLHTRIFRGQLPHLHDEEGRLCLDPKTARFVIKEAYAVRQMVPIKVLSLYFDITPQRIVRRMVTGNRGDRVWDGWTIYGYQQSGKLWYIPECEYTYITELFHGRIHTGEVAELYGKTRSCVNRWVLQHEIPHVVLIQKGRTRWMFLKDVAEAVGYLPLVKNEN